MENENEDKTRSSLKGKSPLDTFLEFIDEYGEVPEGIKLYGNPHNPTEDAFWVEAAEAAGMSVQAYKEFLKAKAQIAREKQNQKLSHDRNDLISIRHKIILSIFAIVPVFILFSVILLDSELKNERIYFHYIHNQRTGEPLGLLFSVFLYILYGWIMGMVPCAISFLSMLTVSSFLHRKNIHRVNSDDATRFAGIVSFAATNIAVAILLFLHVSNIATIEVFWMK